MKVYVVLRNNEACGDPECCGGNEDHPVAVLSDIKKAMALGHSMTGSWSYEEFELDEMPK